jgi:hypothetical protein
LTSLHHSGLLWSTLVWSALLRPICSGQFWSVMVRSGSLAGWNCHPITIDLSEMGLWEKEYYFDHIPFFFSEYFSQPKRTYTGL